MKKTVLVAACLLLAGGPGFDAPRADEAALQPRAARPSNFPHDKHAKVQCGSCHAVAEAPPFEARGRNASRGPFPGHASCTPCHNFAEMFFSPAAFCNICHETRATSKASAGLFEEFQTPREASDFGIGFSHVAHRKPLPAGARIERFVAACAANDFAPGRAPLCTDCHQRDAKAAAFAPEMTAGKGHQTCFVCHGENPVKPPSRNDCAQCHDMELRGQRSPHAPYGRVKDFDHRDHEFDTRPVYKATFRKDRARDYLCAECHSSVDGARRLGDIRMPEAGACAACHNEARRPGLPDPLDAAVLNSLKAAR